MVDSVASAQAKPNATSTTTPASASTSTISAPTPPPSKSTGPSDKVELDNKLKVVSSSGPSTSGPGPTTSRLTLDAGVAAAATTGVSSSKPSDPNANGTTGSGPATSKLTLNVAEGSSLFAMNATTGPGGKNPFISLSLTPSGPGGSSGPDSAGLGLTKLSVTGGSVLGLSGPDILATPSKDLSESDRHGGSAKDFIEAMKTFNDGRARELMDWLEWDQDNNQAQPHNGRFGMNGLLLLSQLDPNSPKWEQGSETFWSIPPQERQRFIDAAKVALDPSNKLLLNQVHGGDGIFEWEDIPNWLAKQPDGVLGSFSQGDVGDCALLAGLYALNQDKDGKEILANAVTLNKDGTYTLNMKELDGVFKPTTFTREEAETGAHASGDIDVMFIEAGIRKFMGGETTAGTSSRTLFEALTGQRNQRFEGGSLTREKLQQMVENDKDGLTLAFEGAVSNKGALIPGEWSTHAFAVKTIDFESNTVAYINPWDSEKIYYISVDDFLKQSINYIEPESTPSTKR